jgi:hypothetical protein
MVILLAIVPIAVVGHWAFVNGRPQFDFIWMTVEAEIYADLAATKKLLREFCELILVNLRLL